MKMSEIPFGTTDWSQVEAITHAGERGEAIWRTKYFGEGLEKIRVRMVEYSAGYLADHWCLKGHILLCLEGTLETELDDGRRFTLTVLSNSGMSLKRKRQMVLVVRIDRLKVAV